MQDAVRRLLERKGLCDRPNERRRMVQRLSRWSLDPAVLQAVAIVPRHAFAPPALAPRAYAGDALCVGDTYLTEVWTVAFMTSHLRLGPDKKVLEIGTGTGYHTTLLSLLSGRVYTIESVPSLVRQSGEAFAALGLKNVSQKLGDGYAGWVEEAPFDAILVAAAAASIPETLVSQLRPGQGRLVMPVGPRRGWQRMRLLERSAAGTARQTDLGCTYFVPFVPGATTLESASMSSASRVLGCQPPAFATAVRRVDEGLKVGEARSRQRR